MTGGCDAGWEGAENAAASRRSPGWRPAPAPPSRPAHLPWSHRRHLPAEDLPLEGVMLQGAHLPCRGPGRPSNAKTAQRLHRRCRSAAQSWKPVLTRASMRAMRKASSPPRRFVWVQGWLRAGATPARAGLLAPQHLNRQASAGCATASRH